MFDATAFLKALFDHPQKVRALLSAYGVEAPNEHAVEKWFRRNSIPGPWLAVILALLELDRGEPVSIIPYFKR